MSPEELLRFLGRIEPLKSRTRHCVTKERIPETVAAHSWGVSMLALLLEEEIPQVDFNRVLRMCMIHDLGEAITGDIPSFHKTEKDEETEQKALDSLLQDLPDPVRKKLHALFLEMKEGSTKEAQLWRALDKIEAVVQHNESPIDTWLPLEFSLNQTYGVREAARFPFLCALREKLKEETIQKIETEGYVVPLEQSINSREENAQKERT